MCPPRHSLLLILAIGMCQCTGLSRKMTIDPSESVRIIFHQGPSRGHITDQGIGALTQTLVTEPVIADRKKFYSDPKSDQLTKVLPVENMQLLLDGLATAGFFDRARPQVMPSSSAYLHAEVDGKHYILSRSATMALAEAESFSRSWGVFMDIYNATQAYRAGDDNNQVIKEHARQQRGHRNRDALTLGQRRW